MRTYDPAFLRAARELCDRHDVFLVVDEVFTGYGRTGPDVGVRSTRASSPDLLCTAKGFTGRHAADGRDARDAARLRAASSAADERAFYYGHSFCGNPLGAAVALEVLRVFEEERILERAAPEGRAHRRAPSRRMRGAARASRARARSA